MINLDNKQERLALATRYLDAETTVQEEQMLARYYATHPVEPDEKEFAAMLAVSRSNADSSLLADTSEFDRIAGKPVSKQHTILAWTAAAAAVSLMIILPLSLRHKPAQSVMSEQAETQAHGYLGIYGILVNILQYLLCVIAKTVGGISN